MLKSFIFFNNEKGFVFPYFLCIAILVLIIVTSSIGTYQNHILMTKLALDQTNLETLYQMSYHQFIDDLTKLQPITESGQSIYTYPNGSVVIDYRQSNSNQLSVDFRVSSKQGGKYARTTTLVLASE